MVLGQGLGVVWISYKNWRNFGHVGNQASYGRRSCQAPPTSSVNPTIEIWWLNLFSSFQFWSPFLYIPKLKLVFDSMTMTSMSTHFFSDPVLVHWIITLALTLFWEVEINSRIYFLKFQFSPVLYVFHYFVFIELFLCWKTRQ